MDQERKKKILIAEDELPLSRALELKLSHEGFAVTVVHDGEAALAAVRAGAPDLLLLDIMMPKKSGYEVLESLRAEQLSVPTIILSNLGQTEDTTKAKSLGAVDFFVKANVPIRDIVERVRAILGA